MAYIQDTQKIKTPYFFSGNQRKFMGAFNLLASIDNIL